MKIPKVIALQVGKTRASADVEPSTGVPVEAAALADEIVAVIPRRPTSDGYTVGSMAKSVVVLRNGRLIDCIEDHETVIRRWLETIAKPEPAIPLPGSDDDRG